MSGSPKYRLNKSDLAKIAKGAAIAGAGCLLAFLATAVTNLDSSTMLGAAVAGIGSVLVNLARKWLTGEN